jgi:phosphoesterase RecJ-like protein
MRHDLTSILSVIQKAKRVLLLTHLHPDGDAIGSVLAFNSLLKRLGKETVVLCQDKVPDSLYFLPGWEQVKSADAFSEIISKKVYDLGIAVDASDYARLGDCGPFFKACPMTMKIDHHATDEQYAQVSYVDVSVAATGVLIFRLFEAIGLPITQDEALYLYTALSTDTGNFSYGNMTEEFFCQIAALMKADLPIVDAARQLHLVKHPASINILARALHSLTYLAEGRLSMMFLRADDFMLAEANLEHAEGIVNHGLNILGVEMTFLATQCDDGVKFSLRCLPPHDVSQVARAFGGGGHVLAAGCTIQKPFDEAVAQMRDYLIRVMQ